MSDELHPTTWAVFRALRAGARLSRNKHFYLFNDPRVRRAMKLHRYLRSVSRDVLAHPDDVHVHREEAGDTYTLRIEIPNVRGRRTAYLSPLELSLLAEDAPVVARLLAERLERGG